MVEFKLTKEQLLAKELFRSFAENEIKPISRDMDEAEKFDMDLLDKMKKYGLMGIPYSKEYGGEGADVLTYALAMEEVSKVDASAGITISVHTSLCCSCINDYASEEQKHIDVANSLWSIREDYISVLTDFDALSENEIMEKRELLKDRTAKVYENAIQTDKRSYAAAQQALQKEEEQFFHEEELVNILPQHLRQ